ncbi:NucA/NucB deoxyribonuclease domain-containing protein [Actinoplanes sp. NPDC049265]|uniref:NucA/NucB deoxyribonuclease domain-containing protein n=1 Tax=Actinoplanes sp. NPDC049265 TaxID=3363902 RepID=UPI0037119854
MSTAHGNGGKFVLTIMRGVAVSALAIAVIATTAGPPAEAAPPSATPVTPAAGPDRSSSGIVPRAQASAAARKVGRSSVPPVDPKHVVTGAELRKRALRSGQNSYTPASTASAGIAAAPPPSTPPQTFLNECNASYAASADEFGYVKNRFEWCRNVIVFHNVFDSSGERSGFMWMDLTIIGYGRDDGIRGMRFFAHPNVVLFEGVYQPTTSVGWNVVCLTNLSSCRNSADQSRTMTEWEALMLTGGWVSSTMTSTSGGGSGEYGEFVQRYYTGIKITYIDGVSDYNGPYWVRCDSADYIPDRSAACVFADVVPHLQYWLTNADGTPSPHEAVAQHIRDAQDRPNSTFPPRPGGQPKVIPGKYTGQVSAETALERVPRGGPAYTENVNAKDDACALLTPPVDMVRPECDEYPFATTEQGAGLGDGNFSVRYVPGSDNGSAGGTLGNYYNNDRILYELEDFFYVEILDTQPNSGTAPNGRPVVSAGPPAYGDEGVPVQLYGTVNDDDGPQVVNRWSYAPLEGVDEGASCTFSSPQALRPTFTCDDDGKFIVTLTADDGHNAPVSASTTVTLRNVAPVVNFSMPTPWQVYRVGDQVSVTAPFTDVTNDRLMTCRVDYDQNGQTVFETQTLTRTCGSAHIFNSPGMYTIEMRVTDDDGGTGVATVLVIAYDPAAGSANIDGSTGTPAGSLRTDPNVAGDTYVTMTAKYYSVPTPTGLTRSWVQNNPFRMEPTGLQWLVVTRDNKVAVRGNGQLNDGTAVQYVLYGWQSPDRMRLLIWSGGGNPRFDQAIYDNNRTGEYDLDRIDPKLMKSGAVQIHRN